MTSIDCDSVRQTVRKVVEKVIVTTHNHEVRAVLGQAHHCEMFSLIFWHDVGNDIVQKLPSQNEAAT